MEEGRRGGIDSRIPLRGDLESDSESNPLFVVSGHLSFVIVIQIDMPLARLLGALLTTTTNRAGGKIDQRLGQSVQGVGLC